MRRSFQTVSLEEVFSETRGHERAGAANSPGPPLVLSGVFESVR